MLPICIVLVFNVKAVGKGGTGAWDGHWCRPGTEISSRALDFIWKHQTPARKTHHHPFLWSNEKRHRSASETIERLRTPLTRRAQLKNTVRADGEWIARRCVDDCSRNIESVSLRAKVGARHNLPSISTQSFSSKIIGSAGYFPLIR